MGKKSCDVPRFCKCVIFNITTGASSGVMIQTDLYLFKNKSTATLQWCTFGGQTANSQTSTTAQNFKIPRDMRPLFDQHFVISGIDGDTGETIPMKLVISPCGEVTFVFSVSGTESPSFVTFEGGSATWISFNCNDYCC